MKTRWTGVALVAIAAIGIVGYKQHMELIHISDLTNSKRFLALCHWPRLGVSAFAAMSALNAGTPSVPITLRRRPCAPQKLRAAGTDARDSLRLTVAPDKDSAASSNQMRTAHSLFRLISILFALALDALRFRLLQDPATFPAEKVADFSVTIDRFEKREEWARCHAAILHLQLC
jgi:hypothetical protein